MRKRLLLVLFLLALVVASLTLIGSGTQYLGEVVDRYTVQGPTGTLTDLHGVDQLRSAFNADAGSPRLLLLLSPT